MKRQTFTLKLAALLVAVSTVLNLQAVNTITYTATYDLSKTTMGTDTLGGVTYTTVHYDGLYNHGDPGMPSLPVDYVRFSVPWNATNFRVSATLNNNQIANIGPHLVYPCQPDRVMCDTTPVIITSPDLTAYALYPQQSAWVVDEGFLAGENHIVTVAVLPYSYTYRKTGAVVLNQLKKSRTVNLTLRYDLSDSLAMYPIVRNDTALRTEGYRLTQSMVVNPANVQAYAPTDMMLDTMDFIIPNSGDGLNGGWDPGIGSDPPISNDSTGNYYGGEMAIDSYPYLIVTTPELLHSVRRIAALKRQKGYNVKVVTMLDVLNSPYSGQGDVVNNVLTYTDDAGKLRQYLRNYYKRYGTDFVLLAGDGVPYRLRQFFSKNAPSDLYFSDFNADWSADTTEKSPELYVGRLLADCSEQITNYTNKLLIYEINPGHGELSYLKRVLYTEGYDMYKPKVREVEKLKVYSDSIFTESIVMREDTSSIRKYPSGVDIVNIINENEYGYLSFHNHAYPTGLLTYGKRSDNICPDDSVYYFLWAIDTVRIIYTGRPYKKDLPSGNGLNCLTNKYHPSVCYSIACLTMPYDTLPNYETIRMNFGKSFTIGKDYGGVAFLGNTREGVLGKSSQLEEQFIQQLIKGNYKLGPAEALSKVLLNNDSVGNNNNGTIVYDKHYFSCVHNLLGDPEFEMWTDIPQQYSGITITRTDNSISISGIGDSLSTVAFYENGGRATKMTVNSSSVTVNADPNSTVMLYKHNYIPYIAPLVLQNVSLSHSQYVIASDVIAGSNVDSGPTSGDVIVKAGVEYEIEASGTVTLQDGFKVEKGATFAVYPSSF